MVAVQPSAEPVVGAPPHALAELGVVFAPLAGCGE